MSGPGCLQSPGFRHGWLAERGKKKVPRGGASGIREAIKASRRRTRRQGCGGRGVYSHRGFAMDGWQSVEKRKSLAGRGLRWCVVDAGIPSILQAGLAQRNPALETAVMPGFAGSSQPCVLLFAVVVWMQSESPSQPGSDRPSRSTWSLWLLFFLKPEWLLGPDAQESALFQGGVMESVNTYRSALGIDVCAQRLDWHRLPGSSSGTFANTPAGIRALVAEVQKAGVDIVVIEATGGLQRQAAAALAGAGIAVAVVNPRQVRDFARAAGQLARPTRSTPRCWR